VNNFRFPEDIQVLKKFLEEQVPQTMVAEWDLEILAKEIILNCGPIPRANHSLRSWDTLAAIINALKDFENNIYVQHGSEKNILIELIRIAHRQFIWQANPPNSVATIRYIKIFNRPEINEIAMRLIGLSVEEIYLCGMAFIGMFLGHAGIDLPIQSNIQTLSSEKISRFLAFTSRSVHELRNLLKSEQQYNEKYPYAYGSLRAFPLIRIALPDKEAIFCPLPTLLFWRMTGGLYYELLRDKKFAQPFGDSYQQYVGDVLGQAISNRELRVISEFEYGLKGARKRSVDWILADSGQSALFIECKAKRLSWNAKSALDDLGPLDSDIDYLGSAVLQVYKTLRDYRDDRFPSLAFAPDRKIFISIVTLENWHMFGPAMLLRLQESVSEKLENNGFDSAFVDAIPYAIWAIEDFEAASQIINTVGIKDFIEGQANDPEMRTWGLHSYLINKFPKFPKKKLFAAEYESFFNKLEHEAKFPSN
jgi:hypothetical protein